MIFTATRSETEKIKHICCCLKILLRQKFLFFLSLILFPWGFERAEEENFILLESFALFGKTITFEVFSNIEHLRE